MEIRKLLSKSGIRQLLSRPERRRSARMQPVDLVAYYWTGGLPRPSRVFEIGVYGARIVAPAAYYRGTIVEFVFEDRAATLNNGTGGHHICIYGRVLRTVADGFCVAFVFEDASQRRKFRQFLNGLKRRNEDETNTEEPTNTAEPTNAEETPIEQRPRTD